MTVGLSPRLRSVESLVPLSAGSVADVGAGHGALCAGLARRATARLIATELTAGPLRELRANLVAWRLSERVEVRCGAGLTVFAPEEVECAVIAGVGAATMLRIATDAPARGVRWLVLQCMQHDHLVQPWLAGHGWPVLATEVSVQRARSYTARLVGVGT